MDRRMDVQKRQADRQSGCQADRRQIAQTLQQKYLLSY